MLLFVIVFFFVCFGVFCFVLFFVFCLVFFWFFFFVFFLFFFFVFFFFFGGGGNLFLFQKKMLKYRLNESTCLLALVSSMIQECSIANIKAI